MSVLQFSYNSHVLTVVQSDGQLWFDASSICHITGKKQMAYRYLESVSSLLKKKFDLSKPPFRETCATLRWYLNVVGVSRLLHTCKDTDELREFKKWLSSDILPAIRETQKFLIQKQA